MIEVESVSKSYPGAECNAVDNVSFTVERGEFLGLIGESGCGKTTTLKLINRLVESNSGTIIVGGDDVQEHDSDIDVILLPPWSSNLNAYCERYMRTMKSECLNKFIFFGERSLRRAVNEFTEHYHSERNHQGIGNDIIEPGDEVGLTGGEIQCNERLGGMLKYYYRVAA